MNSFKQGISSPPPPPPPKKSVQFWAFQLNLRFCLKNSRRTDPHSRMSDMCKKTTLAPALSNARLHSPYRLMMNENATKNRGHAFVEYQDPAHAKEAVKQLNGYALHETKIKVQFNTKQPPWYSGSYHSSRSE